MKEILDHANMLCIPCDFGGNSFFGGWAARDHQITAREIIWRWGGGYQKHLTPGSQSRESGDSWEISGAIFFLGASYLDLKLWNTFFFVAWHLNTISAEPWFPEKHQKHQWCDVEPKSATRHQSRQQVFLNLFIFLKLKIRWRTKNWIQFSLRSSFWNVVIIQQLLPKSDGFSWWFEAKTLWQTHFCLFPRNPKPLTKWRRLFHQSSPRHDTFYRVRFVAKTRNSLRELSSPSRSKVFETTPRKLTWQRKITIFSRRCHVSFPGCKEFRNIQIRLVLGAGIR